MLERMNFSFRIVKDLPIKKLHLVLVYKTKEVTGTWKNQNFSKRRNNLTCTYLSYKVVSP